MRGKRNCWRWCCHVSWRNVCRTWRSPCQSILPWMVEAILVISFPLVARHHPQLVPASRCPERRSGVRLLVRLGPPRECGCRFHIRIIPWCNGCCLLSRCFLSLVSPFDFCFSFARSSYCTSVLVSISRFIMKVLYIMLKMSLGHQLQLCRVSSLEHNFATNTSTLPTFQLASSPICYQ